MRTQIVCWIGMIVVTSKLGMCAWQAEGQQPKPDDPAKQDANDSPASSKSTQRSDPGGPVKQDDFKTPSTLTEMFSVLSSKVAQVLDRQEELSKRLLKPEDLTAAIKVEVEQVIEEEKKNLCKDKVTVAIFNEMIHQLNVEIKKLDVEINLIKNDIHILNQSITNNVNVTKNFNTSITNIWNDIDSINNYFVKIGYAAPLPTRSQSPNPSGSTTPGNYVTRPELDAEIKKLKEPLDALKTLVETHAELVRQISTQPQPGKYALNIHGKMQQLPEFKAEVKTAVHEILDRSGKLVVSNRTGVWQSLWVNGLSRPHWIAPNATEEITVPVGTVTTELRPYEQPKNWTIAPPGYKQVVHITWR